MTGMVALALGIAEALGVVAEADKELADRVEAVGELATEPEAEEGGASVGAAIVGEAAASLDSCRWTTPAETPVAREASTKVVRTENLMAWDGRKTLKAKSDQGGASQLSSVYKVCEGSWRLLTIPPASPRLGQRFDSKHSRNVRRGTCNAVHACRRSDYGANGSLVQSGAQELSKRGLVRHTDTAPTHFYPAAA